MAIEADWGCCQVLLTKGKDALQAGFELSPAQLGLLGAVVVDMQGSYLPAERVEKGPFVAYERPQHVAYISNLAVIPHARRQGIGEQLLVAAENVRSWLGDLFNGLACSQQVSSGAGCNTAAAHRW